MSHASSSLNPVGIARLMGSLATAAPNTTVRHLDVGALVATMTGTPNSEALSYGVRCLDCGEYQTACTCDADLCTQCENEDAVTDGLCAVCIARNDNGPTQADLRHAGLVF